MSPRCLASGAVFQSCPAFACGDPLPPCLYLVALAVAARPCASGGGGAGQGPGRANGGSAVRPDRGSATRGAEAAHTVRQLARSAGRAEESVAGSLSRSHAEATPTCRPRAPPARGGCTRFPATSPIRRVDGSPTTPATPAPKPGLAEAPVELPARDWRGRPAVGAHVRSSTAVAVTIAVLDTGVAYRAREWLQSPDFAGTDADPTIRRPEPFPADREVGRHVRGPGRRRFDDNRPRGHGGTGENHRPASTRPGTATTIAK